MNHFGESEFMETGCLILGDPALARAPAPTCFKGLVHNCQLIFQVSRVSPYQKRAIALCTLCNYEDGRILDEMRAAGMLRAGIWLSSADV
jgi:hypothetical protein